MSTAALIAAILGTFVQYGPQLVTNVTNLIHGNPQKDGETETAYIARINALIDAKAADTSATDNRVENS